MKLSLCFFLVALILYTECVPVGPSRSKNKRAQILSDEFRAYVSELMDAVSQNDRFLENVHDAYRSGVNKGINMSLLSENLREKLNQIKYKTKNLYVEMLRRKRDGSSDEKIALPSDMARILDIGNSNDVTVSDVEHILQLLRERNDAIDEEEVALLNEIEMAKVLERWEAHVNDTDAARVAAQAEFMVNKTAHHKPTKFHDPGSQAREKEQWEKGDQMPLDEYDPKKFFLMHDLNGDGFWDPSEIDAGMSQQLDQLDDSDPERELEYRIQMRQKLMAEADTNKDGLISAEEHMQYVNSFDGLNDRGWEPDDDEDEDLDMFGPNPTQEDLKKIAAKIQHFEENDPNSKMVKYLRDHFDDLKRQIEAKQHTKN